MKENDQLQTMLEMQDRLNSVVNPNWKDAGYNFNLAIADEGMELLNHYGWKWWKGFKPDVPQCRLELVDIFHFLLSKAILLDQKGEKPGAAKLLENVLTEDFPKSDDPQDVRRAIVRMVNLATESAILESNFHAMLVTFRKLMISFDLELSEIFELYVQKNVLNLFRQANGYKLGTYVKIWFDGREDNEHLAEICDSVDFSSTDCQSEIERQLAERYAKNIS
nr:dUTPase [Bdellovibrio sp. HM001]